MIAATRKSLRCAYTRDLFVRFRARRKAPEFLVWVSPCHVRVSITVVNVITDMSRVSSGPKLLPVLSLWVLFCLHVAVSLYN